MKIAKDSVVTMDYTLSDKDGSVIDSSEGNGDFAYLHGHDNIIPGLEKQLEGKEAGAAMKVVVQPGEGYGVKDPQLVTKVSRKQFPPGENLQLGQRFQAASPEGDVQIFEITAIADDEVTIDGNHPLAGVELHFDVKVKDVRKASLEELSHGHVHGAGGHHH